MFSKHRPILPYTDTYMKTILGICSGRFRLITVQFSMLPPSLFFPSAHFTNTVTFLLKYSESGYTQCMMRDLYAFCVICMHDARDLRIKGRIANHQQTLVYG